MTPVSNDSLSPRQRLLFGIILAMVGIFVALGASAEHLLLGWLYFPIRALPNITIDGAALVLGLFCAAAFVFVLHITIPWFLFRLRRDSLAINWSWRRSATISVVFCLLFISGIAMVGATHQFMWLLANRKRQDTANIEPVLGAIEAARDAARQANVSNNQRQLTLGLQYHRDYVKSFPPGGLVNEEGELFQSWAVWTLLDSGIYQATNIDFRVPWNRPPNDQTFKCGIPLFIHPSMPGPYFDAEGYGLSHIAGNQHVMPVRRVASELIRQQDQSLRTSRATIPDGDAHTILLGTVSQRVKPWAFPANVRDMSQPINRSPDGLGGPPQSKGALVSMCDGSVQFLSESTDPKVLRALALPNDGKPN